VIASDSALRAITSSSSFRAIAQAGAGGASRRESKKGGAIAKILKKYESQRLRLPFRKAPALTVGQTTGISH